MWSRQRTMGHRPMAEVVAALIAYLLVVALWGASIILPLAIICYFVKWFFGL